MSATQIRQVGTTATFASVIKRGVITLSDNRTVTLIVDANQEQGLRWDLAQNTVAYLALFTGAHLAVRRFAPYADPLLLPVVALLNGLGLVMIHRLDLA